MGLGSMVSSARAAMLGSVAVPDTVPWVKSKQTLDREAKLAYWMRFRFAERMLSNGGSRPRGSTVRRMMRLLDAKGDARHGARIKVGKSWVHPTKRRAARA